MKTPEQNEKVFHQGLTLAEELEVTIVIPAYNEEGNLRKLHMELTNILGRIRKRFEIIIVDDGSTDGTWNVITEIYQKDRNLSQSIPALKTMMSACGLCQPYVLSPMFSLVAREKELIIERTIAEMNF